MLWRTIRLSHLPLGQAIAHGAPCVQARLASALSTSKPNIAVILSSIPADDQLKITAVGSVRTVRNQKSRSFLELGDGSTTHALQVVLDPTQAEGYVHRYKLDLQTTLIKVET